MYCLIAQRLLTRLSARSRNQYSHRHRSLFSRSSYQTSHPTPLVLRPTFHLFTTIPITLAALTWTYLTWNPYPKAALNPLRKALLGHYYTNDAKGAEQGYLEALQVCEQAGIQPDTPAVTGIHLRLGDLYAHKLQNPDKALETFDSVLRILTASLGTSAASGNVNEEEKSLEKAVEVAQRMGDICRDSNDLKGAERYYEWSVQILLGLRPTPPSTPSASSHPDSTSFLPDERVDMTAMASKSSKPPRFATPTTLGASLEALAGIYAITGRGTLAVPLYINCLSVLQNDTSLANPQKLCRKAILSSNISEVLTKTASSPSPDPSSDPLQHAKHWALSARASALESIKQGGDCGSCLVTVECNLGSICELMHDLKEARAWFAECGKRAEGCGFVDGQKVAMEGLKRLPRT
ncbi:hypothetical protein DFS34DRAFT_594232 [Phlyctochytrium arcticum]|nr:hypothetical protein DFS34DRAFT_594232 [Phlyctochytrium arcticum]